MPERIAFLQGNEACAEGALLAGVQFYGGYPITPSTEIAELLSKRLPEIGGKFIQMEDEIAALGACIGASLTGLKSMTASSGPGMSLKQEHIGYAALCDVPVVIVDVQRGGPSTGLPTQVSQADVMQARWGTHGDHPIIAIAPSSVEEVLYMTIKAFNLSEKLMTPVIVLTDEVIGHMREKVKIPDKDKIELWERKKPAVSPEDYKPFDTDDDDIPALATFGSGYRYNVTGLMHDRAGFPTTRPDEVQDLLDRIHRKIEKHIDIITDVEYYGEENASLGFISYGSSARTTKKAVQVLKQKGINTNMMRIKTLWPIPAKEIFEFCKDKEKVFVVEMNMGQYIHPVKSVSDDPYKIKGIYRYDGDFITPREIIDRVGGF
ncbi:MAG: 2-oxoacid:acceptor oxidoreductase subunit alpha [Candidatus Hydrogenedentota bacterium]